MVSFWEAVTTCLTEKYFTTSGRATRAEYWWFHLFVGIVFGIVNLLFGSSNGLSNEFVGIIIFISLLLIIPSVCVSIRRLHDISYPGWVFFVGLLLPFIFLLVAFMIGSDKDDNKWGPSSNKRIVPLDDSLNTKQSDADKNIVKTEVDL